jgi:hypothetical protein
MAGAEKKAEEREKQAGKNESRDGEARAPARAPRLLIFHLSLWQRSPPLAIRAFRGSLK